MPLLLLSFSLPPTNLKLSFDTTFTLWVGKALRKRGSSNTSGRKANFSARKCKQRHTLINQEPMPGTVISHFFWGITAKISTKKLTLIFKGTSKLACRYGKPQRNQCRKHVWTHGKFQGNVALCISKTIKSQLHHVSRHPLAACL